VRIRTDLAPEVVRHSLFGALSMSLRLYQRQPAGTWPGPDEIGEQVASLVMDGLRPRPNATLRGVSERQPGRPGPTPGNTGD
jgi:hypothetical protein